MIIPCLTHCVLEIPGESLGWGGAGLSPQPQVAASLHRWACAPGSAPPPSPPHVLLQHQSCILGKKHPHLGVELGICTRVTSLSPELAETRVRSRAHSVPLPVGASPPRRWVLCVGSSCSGLGGAQGVGRCRGRGHFACAASGPEPRGACTSGTGGWQRWALAMCLAPALDQPGPRTGTAGVGAGELILVPSRRDGRASGTHERSLSPQVPRSPPCRAPPFSLGRRCGCRCCCCRRGQSGLQHLQRPPRRGRGRGAQAPEPARRRARAHRAARSTARGARCPRCPTA